MEDYKLRLSKHGTTDLGLSTTNVLSTGRSQLRMSHIHPPANPAIRRNKDNLCVRQNAKKKKEAV